MGSKFYRVFTGFENHQQPRHKFNVGLSLMLMVKISIAALLKLFYQAQFVRLPQVFPEPFDNHDRRFVLMQVRIAGD